MTTISASEPLREEQTRVDIVSLTDKGPARSHNEDSIAVVRASGYAALSKGTLLVVADGMGGLAHGEVASSMVTSLLPELYFESRIINPTENLVHAIGEVNARVHKACEKNGPTASLGTTVAASVIVNGTVVTANVGDSRVYLWHNNSLRQISRDHSMRKELFSPFQESEISTFSHVLTQAIGPQPSVLPHVSVCRMAEHDILLLCTDGLTAVLRDKEIEKVLNDFPFEEVLDQLVGRVYDLKGDDNISIILARIIKKAV